MGRAVNTKPCRGFIAAVVALAACSAPCAIPVSIHGSPRDNGRQHVEVRCGQRILASGECAHAYAIRQPGGVRVVCDGKTLAIVTAADVTEAIE